MSVPCDSSPRASPKVSFTSENIYKALEVGNLIIMPESAKNMNAILDDHDEKTNNVYLKSLSTIFNMYILTVN